MTEIDNAIIRALCILAHAEHNPLWTGWNEKRLAWARDIVRQIADQPIPKIDGRGDND